MLVEITFLALAALVLASAVMVLRVREMVHSTVWLATMLFATAGIFLTLGAEFLATIQVLVYVGAIVTLILFTIMMTQPVERDYLAALEVPPGVTIESIEDIQRATPSFSGAGPYKDFDASLDPRRPQRKPDTLYGVSLVDNEYGTDQTDRSKEAK